MIDIDFDCYLDTPEGKDPDSFSPTLRASHQFLWSKQLPDGRYFQLDADNKPFLTHNSDIGEFWLKSDAITHTYRGRPTIKPLLPQLPSDLAEYVQNAQWLISECILFPGKRINGQNTINGARGMNTYIDDRFDLTLECIKRHYEEGRSPLSEVLLRYQDFFQLFEDFRGYVEFFLLQDLVNANDTINFYIPFSGFEHKALPRGLDPYVRYLNSMREFGAARAERMKLGVALKVLGKSDKSESSHKLRYNITFQGKHEENWRIVWT
ncbi:MAG: hypothetical protein IT206_04815 [Fimbriimonadaceae bacterium]|nr:hypothetical protein [Fimbriimonadaceae bacterium]